MPVVSEWLQAATSSKSNEERHPTNRSNVQKTKHTSCAAFFHGNAFFTIDLTNPSIPGDGCRTFCPAWPRSRPFGRQDRCGSVAGAGGTAWPGGTAWLAPVRIYGYTRKKDPHGTSWNWAGDDVPDMQDDRSLMWDWGRPMWVSEPGLSGVR